MSEAEILTGHFAATRARVADTSGPVLVLHDTTEFSYKREDIEAVGKTRIGVASADYQGRPRHYTACGMLIHSSLAVTPDGLPLGMTAVKFWTRTSLETRLLDQLTQNDLRRSGQKTLSSYLTRLARLGGYLARANDLPPGNMVIWRGMSRLTDIKIGYTLAQHVGN